MRILDALRLKYKLALPGDDENFSPEQWRDQLMSRFEDDPIGRIMALIEPLRINDKLKNNIFEKQGA